MTYDDTDEIRQLAEEHRLSYHKIPMKTTHHLQKLELLISDRLPKAHQNLRFVGLVDSSPLPANPELLNLLAQWQTQIH